MMTKDYSSLDFGHRKDISGLYAAVSYSERVAVDRKPNQLKNSHLINKYQLSKYSAYNSKTSGI